MSDLIRELEAEVVALVWLQYQASVWGYRCVENPRTRKRVVGAAGLRGEFSHLTPEELRHAFALRGRLLHDGAGLAVERLRGAR